MKLNKLYFKHYRPYAETQTTKLHKPNYVGKYLKVNENIIVIILGIKIKLIKYLLLMMPDVGFGHLTCCLLSNNATSTPRRLTDLTINSLIITPRMCAYKYTRVHKTVIN